jgi:hypothetical protein
MKKLLKVLNPFIWCWNVFSYFAHLEGQKHREHCDHPACRGGYQPYDFSKDLKYF